MSDSIKEYILYKKRHEFQQCAKSRQENQQIKHTFIELKYTKFEARVLKESSYQLKQKLSYEIV